MNETRPAARGTDEGFTLIEVLVAILVLALISTGVLASMTTIMRLTADNRARIVAVNLASQDLDLARAVGDPYKIPALTDQKQTIDGTTYVLNRTVAWVSTALAGVGCNNASSQFTRRVNVRVTWGAMLDRSNAVQDDTLIAPTESTSNATTGAAAITVTSATGAPVSAAVVTILPVSGGATAPPMQPVATTIDGCTFAGDLQPGTYSVRIVKPGYIDTANDPAPAQQIQVAAGKTTQAPFTFDRGATYVLRYHAGPADGSTAVLPSDVPVNLLSTGGTKTYSSPPSSALLFPWPSGYAAVVGRTVEDSRTCASVDPQAWNDSSTPPLQTGARATAAAAPGATAVLDVPVGLVRVTAPSGTVFTATQAVPDGVGNPGCGFSDATLSWTQRATSSTTLLALPYGSWTVRGDGAAVPASRIAVQSNQSTNGVSADGTVTLDPRRRR